MPRLFSLRAPRRWPRRTGAITLLLVLLLGVSVFLAVQWQAGSSGQMKRTTCIALETNPRVRLGMFWTAPILSSLPSLAMAPYKACVETPFSLAQGGAPWLPREWLLIP